MAKMGDGKHHEVSTKSQVEKMYPAKVGIPPHLQPMTVDDTVELAIRVGYEGWGKVAPNPMVGCVIVDHKHRFLAVGAHRQYGGSHAEIDALSHITDASLLEGALVYVTLEPCSHQGRTPSCALALSQLPIAGVNYLVQDPNPLVNGNGLEILRRSGKQIVWLSEGWEKGELLAEIFLTNVRQKRPFVALKVAATLDGAMARHGQGKHWFTGPQAGEYTHYLRAGYDAILVGANTLAMDNPRLNVRHKNFPHQRNKLVILDPMGSAFREDLNIFSDHRREEVFWVVSPTIDEQKIMERAQTLICGIDAHGYFKLDILLETLFEKGIRSIFLEGGSHVYGSFLNQSMVDRLYVYTSPQVGWGGGHGESVYWTQSVKADVPLKLQNICQLSLGEDLLTTGRITPLGE